MRVPKLVTTWRRRAAAAAVVGAIGALGAVGAAASASAATAGGSMCATNNTATCVYGPSIAAGDPLYGYEDGSYRNITLEDQGFTKGGFEVYRLGLSNGECIGFSDTGKAEARDCLGKSNYTNWERDTSGSGSRYYNANFPDLQGQSGTCPRGTGYNYLAWDGIAESRLVCGGIPGDYIRWTVSG